jgi:hypothetical protein
MELSRSRKHKEAKSAFIIENKYWACYYKATDTLPSSFFKYIGEAFSNRCRNSIVQKRKY